MVKVYCKAAEESATETGKGPVNDDSVQKDRPEKWAAEGTGQYNVHARGRDASGYVHHHAFHALMRKDLPLRSSFFCRIRFLPGTFPLFLHSERHFMRIVSNLILSS